MRLTDRHRLLTVSERNGGPLDKNKKEFTMCCLNAFQQQNIHPVESLKQRFDHHVPIIINCLCVCVRLCDFD